MAQYGSEPDDGGSLAGSPANASLTGDKLRRRPAHSRKPSVESVDLENDTLLPAALERMQILSGSSLGLSAPGAGRPPRRLRGPTAEGASARESVASADEAVARDGSSGESSRAAEVTSAEKPFSAVGSGDKIRAIVASGGALYDKPDGSRGYRGGDTRLVSIRRGATFDALSALLDDDDDDDAKTQKRKKRQKVYYRDPNDGVTLLRVARDADIDEMFEEWDRRMATLVRDAFTNASNANPEKLKVYVVEKSGSADSEPATPRMSREQSKEQLTKMTKSASASVGLQNVPSAELTLVHRLGGGAFGEVHLALWRGAEVAVKFTRAKHEKHEKHIQRVDSEHDVSEDEDGEEEALDAREALASRESFLKEARTMAALHHPNVVFVYGVVDDGDRLGIVEEFMRSGSLRRLLNLHVREAKERAAERSSETNGEGEGEGEGEGDAAALQKTRSKKPTGPNRGFGKRHLSATVRARCALDVARGMAYLHSRRFVHFDLKCDNVLTARQLGVAGGVTCKVADFGLSKQQRGTVTVGGDGGGADVEPRDKNEPDDKKAAREFTSGIASQRGTLPWTAPELFSDPAGATESVDAYSFGVCMWELWTCDVPFRDEREQSVVWGIMTGKRPEVPCEEQNEPVPGYRDLMTALWREDPRARPTFDETVAILEDALLAKSKRVG